MFKILGIVVYFLNFFTGKSRNQKIANQWFNSHINLLESQFSLGKLFMSGVTKIVIIYFKGMYLPNKIKFFLTYRFLFKVFDNNTYVFT